MRPAKILSAIGTLVYISFYFWPPFNVSAFEQILKEYNQSIYPIVRSMSLVALMAAALNLLFFVFTFIFDAKSKKIKHDTAIGLLLFIAPIFVMYILFALTA